MSSIIIDPNESPVELPDTEFWNKPVSRKAFQVMLNQIGRQMDFLYAGIDTANILINFLMEKAQGDKDPVEFRKEVDSWVEAKKKAIEEMQKTAPQVSNEQKR